MNLTAPQLHELAAVAIDAGTAAAELIARSRPSQVDYKAEGASLASQIVTEVDRQSEALIVDRLSPTLDRHELALLTEETDDDGGRLSADHFWCIDPIDGTLPFVEGRPGYAVSIALVRRDGVPLIGVVADPVTSTLRHAVAGGGAFVDGEPWPERQLVDRNELVVFADPSLLAGDDRELVESGLDAAAADLGFGGVDLRFGAGAVLNACGVLDERAACYPKFPVPTGGGHLWDYAATACIAAEVGAVVTDIHGDPLDLNRADHTRMNHRGSCFATDERIAARVRAIARTLARPPGDGTG